MFNAIFGFVAYVFAHYALFSADGQACWNEPSQKNRGNFMMFEIGCFYIVYIVCICFMAAFPKVAYELASGSFKNREAKRQAEAEQ